MKQTRDNFQRKLFSAGTRIFEEGDAPNCAYLLNSGQIEISTSKGGTKIVLNQIAPGEIFGDFSLIDDLPRSATATAMTDCRVTVVPAESFYKHLDTLDDFTCALVKYMVARIRDLSRRAEGLP